MIYICYKNVVTLIARQNMSANGLLFLNRVFGETSAISGEYDRI